MPGDGLKFSKFPNGRTLMEDREQKKRDAANELATAYLLVDVRDQLVCRISGVRLHPGHTDPRKRLERHHMQPRSTAPDLRHDPANILTVSAFVHDQLTRHKWLVEGDANLKDPDGRFCGVSLYHNCDEGYRFVRLV